MRRGVSTTATALDTSDAASTSISRSSAHPLMAGKEKEGFGLIDTMRIKCGLSRKTARRAATRAFFLISFCRLMFHERSIL